MPKRTGRPWSRVKAQVIARDGGICHLCNRLGADTADHLRPVALGGAWYDMSNLAAAHQRCNKQRGIKPPGQMRARLTKPLDNGWKW